MCLRVSYKKKTWKNFFASSKSTNKGVGSESISQRCGLGSAPKCHGSPTLISPLCFSDFFSLVLSAELDAAAVQHPGGASREPDPLLGGGDGGGRSGPPSSSSPLHQRAAGRPVSLPPLQGGNPGADRAGCVADLSSALHLPEGGA